MRPSLSPRVLRECGLPQAGEATILLGEVVELLGVLAQQPSSLEATVKTTAPPPCSPQDGKPGPKTKNHLIVIQSFRMSLC